MASSGQQIGLEGAGVQGLTMISCVQLELTNANELLQREKRDLNSFLEKRDRDIQRLKGEAKDKSWLSWQQLMLLAYFVTVFCFFLFFLHKAAT